MGGGSSRPYVSASQIADDAKMFQDAIAGYNQSWVNYWKDRGISQSDVNDYNLDAYTLDTNISLATLNNWVPQLITNIINFNNIFGTHIQNPDGSMTTGKNVNSVPYLLNTTTPLINKTYDYTWLYVYCSNQVEGKNVQQYVNNLKNGLAYTQSLDIN
jgi:hypothetical protein